MNAETTPNGSTAATADRSIELVNRLLKLPEQVRLDLAHLLLDSVREGFTSLAEADQHDRDKIRQRVEQVVRGEVELLDADDVVTELERRYQPEKPS